VRTNRCGSADSGGAIIARVRARFYAPDAHAPGDVVVLPEFEAQHVTRVLRLKAGDAVRVFNGRGGEFEAAIEAVIRHGVHVRMGDRRDAAPEPRVSVTLAQAVLKGDKMDDVVRDAVMMGVTAIQPIVTTRTEVTLAALARGRRLERWARIAIASAKQCGRAVVPPILQPCAVAGVPLAAMTLPAPALMLVEPGVSAHATFLRDLDLPVPTEATLIVGPEGGWTPQEVELASAAWRLVTLGGRTLRADAMPIVALSALFARWREF
jgi:16S rRNA (uracil1498-N3)-methyltransferase